MDISHLVSFVPHRIGVFDTPVYHTKLHPELLQGARLMVLFFSKHTEISRQISVYAPRPRALCFLYPKIISAAADL